MGVIQLPVGRLRPRLAERSALRRGVSRPHLSVVKLHPQAEGDANRYCDRCSEPIRGGAVVEGRLVYCSLECSMGEPPPAAG